MSEFLILLESLMIAHRLIIWLDMPVGRWYCPSEAVVVAKGWIVAGSTESAVDMCICHES
jgi:hypothetical protein